MASIELTDEEHATLRAVLESDVADLRMEISDTDAQDFRDALKHREEILKRLIARLGGSQA